MKKTFLAEVFVDVEIEDEKIPELLKDFRESISSTATIDDVFSQIAYNEVNGGGFCEGIGAPGKEFNVEITDIEVILVDADLE